MKLVSIHIGELHASRGTAIVETVLGSCVAACLYDPVSRVGGMNHFLLPKKYRDDPILARYGEYAMELLIQRIVDLGGKRSNLWAKAFGAASVLKMEETRHSVPRANERFVREFLKTNDIPLLGELMGGENPIKVRMCTNTGKAMARALPRTQPDPQLAKEAELYATRLARRWAWFDKPREVA